MADWRAVFKGHLVTPLIALVARPFHLALGSGRLDRLAFGRRGIIKHVFVRFLERLPEDRCRARFEVLVVVNVRPPFEPLWESVDDFFPFVVFFDIDIAYAQERLLVFGVNDPGLVEVTCAPPAWCVNCAELSKMLGALILDVI